MGEGSTGSAGGAGAGAGMTDPGAGCGSSGSHFVSTAASEWPAAGGLQVVFVVRKKTQAAVVILVQAWRTDAAIEHWSRQPAAEFCHLWSSPQNTIGWLANVQLLPHFRCFSRLALHIWALHRPRPVHFSQFWLCLGAMAL